MFRFPKASLLPLIFSLGAGLLVWWLADPSRGGPGLTWDEAYYYPTFEAVRGWSASFFRDPFDALSPRSVHRGWHEINELPPVVKWLGGLAVSIPAHGWDRLWVARLFPAAAFAASLFLLWRISLRYVPRHWSWLAPLVYACQPVVAGHAQLAASETVFAAAMLLVWWLALRARGHGGWLLVGLGLGLALATKVNGLITVTAVVIWLLAAGVFAGRGLQLRRRMIPLALVMIAAPLAAFAVWPWLWYETGTRLAAYWVFIREHAHHGLWFAGERLNFGGPQAPLWYPMAALHLSTPIVVLALMWGGLAGVLAAWLRRGRLAPRDLLMLLLIAGPLAAASLPAAPKYDGTRLFFPVYAPLTVLAVRGCWLLLRRLETPPRRRLLPIAIAVLLFAAAPLPLLRASIDFYNVPAQLIGSRYTPFGFEQTYWGNAISKPVIDHLNSTLRPRAPIKTLALQPLSLDLLQRWTVLRTDIKINPEPPYDVHLIQNRRGFWGNAEWSIYTGREPLKTWGTGEADEPLIMLYDGRPPGL